MSKHQLVRMEGQLDNLATSVSRLEADVTVLKADVAELKADVAELKTDVAVLKTDVAVLKTDVAELKIGQTRLEDRIDEVDRHMGVLHEDTLDRIRALDHHEGLRLEMRRGFAEIRGMFAEHLAVDGDAHRYFAGLLTEHGQRLDILERPRP